MPNLSPMEIILVVLVVLLLFGAKRLPDLARGVGKSLKILKNEVQDHNDDDRQGTAPITTAPTSAGATTPSITYPLADDAARSAGPQDRIAGS